MLPSAARLLGAITPVSDIADGACGAEVGADRAAGTGIGWSRMMPRKCVLAFVVGSLIGSTVRSTE